MKTLYLKIQIPDNCNLNYFNKIKIVLQDENNNIWNEEVEFDEIDLHVLLKKQRELCTINKVNEHMYNVVTEYAILNSPEPDLP